MLQVGFLFSLTYIRDKNVKNSGQIEPLCNFSNNVNKLSLSKALEASNVGLHTYTALELLT